MQYFKLYPIILLVSIYAFAETPESIVEFQKGHISRLMAAKASEMQSQKAISVSELQTEQQQKNLKREIENTRLFQGKLTSLSEAIAVTKLKLQSEPAALDVLAQIFEENSPGAIYSGLENQREQIDCIEGVSASLKIFMSFDGRNARRVDRALHTYVWALGQKKIEMLDQVLGALAQLVEVESEGVSAMQFEYDQSQTNLAKLRLARTESTIRVREIEKEFKIRESELNRAEQQIRVDYDALQRDRISVF